MRQGEGHACMADSIGFRGEYFWGSLKASRGEDLEIEEPVACRDAYRLEEIDVAFFNEETPDGLPLLPCIILVECKNWLKLIGSEHVGRFDTKMRYRGVEFGILFAANNITGNPALLTDAQQHYRDHSQEGPKPTLVSPTAKSPGMAVTGISAK